MGVVNLLTVERIYERFDHQTLLLVELDRVRDLLDFAHGTAQQKPTVAKSAQMRGGAEVSGFGLWAGGEGLNIGGLNELNAAA